MYVWSGRPILLLKCTFIHPVLIFTTCLLCSVHLILKLYHTSVHFLYPHVLFSVAQIRNFPKELQAYIQFDLNCKSLQHN